MSGPYAPCRFTTGADRRLGRSKNVTESEAVFDFQFSSIDDESGSGDRDMRATLRKKSTAQKYAADDTTTVQDAAPYLSGSDVGALCVAQDHDPNPEEIAAIPFDPHFVQDAADLKRRLDLMHDRCIARNLRAAGLGGFETERDEAIYGPLDPNARMITGEPMLIGTILSIENQDLQPRYASILLTEGADANRKDESGKTALMHACAGGYDRVAKVLLQYEKTNLLARDEDGNTALMYAAAVGASKIVKQYLKALRKYERIVSHRAHHSFEESPLADGTGTIGQPNMSSSAHGRLWSSSGEDPLDIQNAEGNTARALALKNGHVECANLLNEERLRRVKEMNKRLNSISHHRVRMTKKLAQRRVPHSSSFDSIYYDQEDRSDDDLMHAKPATGRGAVRRRTPATASVEIDQYEEEPKSFKSKMRFQSNPDLFRMRHSSSLEATRQETTIEAMFGARFFGGDAEKAAGGSQNTRRRQTVQGALEEALIAEKPRAQRLRKYTMHIPTFGKAHQPLIGPPSTSGPSAATKRNLTEKLINFLRRRPKQATAAGGPETADPSDPFSSSPHPLSMRRACGRSMNRSKPRPSPQCRSASVAKSFDECAALKSDSQTRDPEPRESDDEDENEVVGRLRKNCSQPETGSKGPSLLRYARKASPSAGADATAAVRAIREEAILKRRSIDLSFMSAFRNQFLCHKSDDPSAAGQTTIVPLSAPAQSVTLSLVSATVSGLEQQKMAESGSLDVAAVSNLPRLSSSAARQKRCVSVSERSSEAVGWANEETSDSGLTSSIASATGSSRPVSADSTESHRTVPVGGIGRR